MANQTKNKTTQESITEIQKIYDLFMVKLNKLRKDKNKVIQNIFQRIDDQKVSDILKELKDRY